MRNARHRASTNKAEVKRIDVAIGNQSVSVEVPVMTLNEALPLADAISLHIPAQADGKAGDRPHRNGKK